MLYLDILRLSVIRDKRSVSAALLLFHFEWTKAFENAVAFLHGRFGAGGLAEPFKILAGGLAIAVTKE